MVRRAAALLALLVVLFTYDEIAPHLWREGVWWDVAWISLVLMPLTFAMVLIALPFRDDRRVPYLALAFAILAAVLTVVNFDVPANFARLAAASLFAWWFLSFFETLAWVVVVACVIPWVDALSVWRGPTKTITTQHPHVFSVLSYAFPVPGRHGAANLGIPDLLFFALFLAAAAQWQLRVYWTWVCLVAGLGLTIAATVYFDLSGLPALPAVAVGLLLPNADLIWRYFRENGLGLSAI
ncbi:MAG TPA: hypothetical protein VGU02_07050 [Gaiellaceae bacterium]|nr:hypothetical protein [Gaiellaceae bacterium]